MTPTRKARTNRTVAVKLDDGRKVQADASDHAARLGPTRCGTYPDERVRAKGPTAGGMAAARRATAWRSGGLET